MKPTNKSAFLYTFWFLLISQIRGEVLRDPGQFQAQITLLDSYIPAAMQIIAHLTESMKYELAPTPEPTSTTPSSSSKPTSTHKPGIYAPDQPLGQENYEKLQSELVVNDDTSERKVSVETAIHVENDVELPENLENLIGDGAASLIRFINSQDADVSDGDTGSSEEAYEQAVAFSKNFDDSNFQEYLQRNKKAPPTKAYVTLLSLYDSLSKDAKLQGYNKYQGYHQHVLQALSETSSLTSAKQLEVVLRKIVTNQDSKQPDVRKKIDSMLNDLEMGDSYINKALQGIPPLIFAL